jgi:hypothetical protein
MPKFQIIQSHQIRLDYLITYQIVAHQIIASHQIIEIITSDYHQIITSDYHQIITSDYHQIITDYHITASYQIVAHQIIIDYHSLSHHLRSPYQPSFSVLRAVLRVAR